MYVLYGFTPHSVMAQNTPGANNPIGELSTQSLTYTKEKGIYTSTVSTGPTLITFKSATDDVEAAVSLEISEQVLKFVARVYNRTLTNPSVPQAIDVILQDLQTQYAAEANTFSGGQIKTDGRYYLPEWISWKNTAIGDSDIKIWFADEAFQNEYPFYSISVIPPVDNLDDFFLAGAQVETLLKARTVADTMGKIQAVKIGFPETVIAAEIYDYVDPITPSHTVPSTWSVLIYGMAGNNIDAIKQALIDYILTNSTHTRDDWVQILPDLFKRTEFILIPLWDQYAIPNRITRAGIYSPIANLARVSALLKAKIPSYLGSHIDSYATVMGHPYKSLAIASIGSNENKDNHFQLSDVFVDYIAVSSTSLDFNRMSETTKTWALMLANILLTAEEIDVNDPVPVGMTKLTRDGIIYVVQSLDNIQYLIAARVSIDPTFGTV